MNILNLDKLLILKHKNIFFILNFILFNALIVLWVNMSESKIVMILDNVKAHKTDLIYTIANAVNIVKMW